MCDTLEKYTCMLAMIQIAGDEVPWHCQKSCKAENYKIARFYACAIKLEETLLLSSTGNLSYA